jgi:uncharacterized radical SAM protein YgiQ
MYEMRCTKPEVEAICRRLSCVHPKICPLLGTDQGPLIKLLEDARNVPGIRKVLVASGVRMDLARLQPRYVEELASHYTGGHLKVAPEHSHPGVLHWMKKPPIGDFEAFSQEFTRASEAAGRRGQVLVPYFIASHPGSDLASMVELALFLKKNNFRPDQVQDFIPAPMDVAASMYHTGMDPFTRRPLHVAKTGRERRLQRALLQFFKPENYRLVREALQAVGREDLIGNGPNCLIPARPPAPDAPPKQGAANQIDGKPRAGLQAKAGPPGTGSASRGYRPHRKTARRRPR